MPADATPDSAAPDAATRYRSRLRRVLEHIEAHLDEDLDGAALARVAAFSKFHFHRQFTASLGVGMARYLQLRRMKRASYRLAFRGTEPVLEIALDAGYEGPEAFARAFRKTVGQSPSGFRREPHWENWHALFDPISEIRRTHMPASHTPADVRIVDTADIAVALLEHRGDPRRLSDTIRAFITWRRQHGLHPAKSATYNIAYNDPVTTPPEDFRFALAAATTMAIASNETGVTAGLIPGGRCAVLRHRGSDDALGEAVRYLYAGWLPQSGRELRDFPVYFQRVRFFPDVPEQEAVTDIFLPLT